MPLTETEVRTAAIRERPYKLADERGLYVLVNPSGSRLWRFKYRFGGSEKLLALGRYPDTSLGQARAKRDAARTLLADGEDPGTRRRAEKAGRFATFTDVAEEWLETRRGILSESTWRRDRDQLFDIVGPHLGARLLRDIAAPDLLAVLRGLEKRGVRDTAHRVRAVCGRVFRYAIATGRASRDISADLKGALAPKRPVSYAAITDPRGVGELLRAIDAYHGQKTTHAALRVAAYVFVRPGELRAAEWSEFSFELAEWRIPAKRMKMRQQHVVPLARQVLDILRELHGFTGAGSFVFPTIWQPKRPMSENTVNNALRRLGYTRDQMTAHGFRTVASTLLNEQGWHPDLIELQLAHRETNRVRAAYNRAQRLAERRRMMQAWADYLDGLRAGESPDLAGNAVRSSN